MHEINRRIYYMPIQIEEPVKASLVILNVGLFGPTTINNLILELDKVTNGNVMFSTSINGVLRLSIEKERISVNLQDGVAIDKDYPEGVHDLSHLSEIAELVIANIKQINPTLQQSPVTVVNNASPEQLKHTFGFNLQVGCKYHPTVQSSGLPIERFMNVEKLRGFGCDGFDGIWDLDFNFNKRRWKLSVKPFPGVHDGNSLLVYVNCHFENQMLPRDRSEINGIFQDTWDGVTKFVDAMEMEP